MGNETGGLRFSGPEAVANTSFPSLQSSYLSLFSDLKSFFHQVAPFHSSGCFTVLDGLPLILAI